MTMMDVYSRYESQDHPGWYRMECAPIGLSIDLTDGDVTCHNCRLQKGQWIGAGNLSPTHWRLSELNKAEARR
jgi:hypothetical protein